MIRCAPSMELGVETGKPTVKFFDVPLAGRSTRKLLSHYYIPTTSLRSQKLLACLFLLETWGGRYFHSYFRDEEVWKQQVYGKAIILI